MYYLESQKIDHQVLNGIADLVRVSDTAGNYVFVNDAMKNLLGYDDEKGICDLETFLYNPDIMRRALLTGEVIQREEEFNDKYFSVKCSPVLGKLGEIIGIVEVFRNITTEKKLQRALVDKNKSMTTETIAAGKIQHSLLPEKGFLKNIKIEYIYKPVNILSGDIFDVFSINEDLTAVYIADTVGHGFAASMVTMFVKTIIRTLPSSALMSPALTLKNIYKKFSSLKLDIENYFTCFYGVINTKKNSFVYANAGHVPVAIKFSDNDFTELNASGYPITMLLDPYDYKESQISFNTGDKFLFMTDGIVEQKNEIGEEFGLDRIVKIVREKDGDELRTLNDNLIDFIDLKQKDDLSVVLLKIW